MADGAIGAGSKCLQSRIIGKFPGGVVTVRSPLRCCRDTGMAFTMFFRESAKGQFHKHLAYTLQFQVRTPYD